MSLAILRRKIERFHSGSNACRRDPFPDVGIMFGKSKSKPTICDTFLFLGSLPSGEFMTHHELIQYFESCVWVWTSHYENDIEVLGYVQRKTTNLMKGLEHKF